MSEAGVAYRYAKPLLELSVEKGIEDEVYNDMKLFSETCAENRELVVVLKNPVIRGYKKYAILQKLFGDKMNKLTLSLFEIMTRKSREKVLQEVSKAYIALYNRHKGIQHVLVSTAIALDATQKKDLEKKLADSLNKTIVLEEEVDPSLIGGFVVEIGQSQIDASIKNNLKRVERDFIQNIHKN